MHVANKGMLRLGVYSEYQRGGFYLLFAASTVLTAGFLF